MVRVVLVCCVLLILAVLPSLAAPGDDLTVLPRETEGVAPSGMMDAYLKRQAFAALDARAAEYEKLKTPDDLRAHQRRLRQFFLEQLGPLPERTPLNAQVTGKMDRGGYRVEKVIYESQPGFHVTATLYLPVTAPPYPAVLVPCGHSENGKASEAYQRASILLARHGLAALCFDPVGQGERKQILDAEGKGRFRATSEHAVEAPGAVLLGRNLATYMVWDGMRSIDYLASRDDIDATKIGIAGNSGGGTQSSYLMALDDRIAAAAPNCYLTTFRRLLETIGPQDPEQNIHGQLAAGMDHADYLLLRAPKPTLIGAVTRDFFDIGGTWDTFRQAKRFYTRLGVPERVDLVEADSTHGFVTELRCATTQFMRRWLMGKDDPVTEPAFPVMTDQEIQCTPRGQVIHLPGARTIFDLNKEFAERLAAERRRYWNDAGISQAMGEARRLAGVRRAGELKADVRRLGTIGRQGYQIEKLALRMEPGITLPALLFQPPAPRGEPYLYLHGEGKHVDAGADGPIEKLVRDGHAVMAVDLRGTGELQARNQRGEPQGTSGKDVATAYLLGRSYVGMRAEDALRCALLLPGLTGNRPGSKVRLLAVGEAGPPALHAAAFEPELFSGVTLVRSLRSWEDVVRTPVTANQRVNVVHGALKAYDLPDLIGVFGQEKVTIVEPLDAAGERAR